MFMFMCPVRSLHVIWTGTFGLIAKSVELAARQSDESRKSRTQRASKQELARDLG